MNQQNNSPHLSGCIPAFGITEVRVGGSARMREDSRAVVGHLNPSSPLLVTFKLPVII